MPPTLHFPPGVSRPRCSQKRLPKKKKIPNGLEAVHMQSYLPAPNEPRGKKVHPSKTPLEKGGQCRLKVNTTKYERMPKKRKYQASVGNARPLSTEAPLVSSSLIGVDGSMGFACPVRCSIRPSSCCVEAGDSVGSVVSEFCIVESLGR